MQFQVNLIYLASLSGRVPIIPPFTPGPHLREFFHKYFHRYSSLNYLLAKKAGTLSFGQIFNISLLRKDLSRPILEWSDVKYNPTPTSIESPPDSEREPLGCWSTKPEYDPQPMRANPTLNNLKLDVSYTRVPKSTRHTPDNNRDDFVIFGKLVPYIFSHNPLIERFEFMSPGPTGHRLPPDEHLSCFDHLYYTTSSEKTFEWEAPWSPAWNFVGKHVHFTNDLVDTAKGYLSRAFNLSDGEILPPVSSVIGFFPAPKTFTSSEQFIAIHSRRGDFESICTDPDHPEPSCLNPLSTFAEKVDEIRANLSMKHNVNVTRVLLASSEFFLKYQSLSFNLN